MKIRLILALCALVTFAEPAGAHRLNEYLQATTISLTKDSVMLHLHLTAGSDIARQVIKSIDLNTDGVLSEGEQDAYAQLVIHALSLTVDGSDMTLGLMSQSFPTMGEMIKGVGDIQFIIAARYIQSKTLHHVSFSHLHQRDTTVYLVNCLLPADDSIRIISQTRNVDQSVYQLDFTVGYSPLPITTAQQQSMENANKYAVFKTYFTHGVRHILSGYDHLIFLCALVLCAASLWNLIKIVTAFTIAHSVTFTFAALGLAHLSQQIVEPLIAASIVFVAIQNIVWPKSANGYNRLAVAFFFGLFHGLGFAGGLLELMHAMPGHLAFYAIAGFSVGVEAGNQLVLLPLYGTLQLLRQTPTTVGKLHQLQKFQRYASVVIGVAGIYYLCIALYACFN